MYALFNLLQFHPRVYSLSLQVGYYLLFPLFLSLFFLQVLHLVYRSQVLRKRHLFFTGFAQLYEGLSFLRAQSLWEGLLQ